MPLFAPDASAQTVLSDNTAVRSGYVRHPWAGKRVGYIGDSITDPKTTATTSGRNIGLICSSGSALRLMSTV